MKKTKDNPEKNKQHKIQQNKTSLVQSPHKTVGQETKWAYALQFQSPHAADSENYADNSTDYYILRSNCLNISTKQTIQIPHLNTATHTNTYHYHHSPCKPEKSDPHDSSRS